MKTCDIIIVSYNAVEYLKQCIDSIKKYTSSISYKLIVVDNNSNNETKQYLKTLEQYATIIYNKKNYGFGFANNQAINISKSDYVCFLNSDTIVTENWLERLIDIIDEDKRIGLVGPMSNFVSSTCQLIDFPKNSDIQSFANNLFYEHKFATETTTRLIGFCLVTKNDRLKNVGCFDERYMIGCFEDDDLGLRFIERGYSLQCAKGVFVFHYGGKSFETETKNNEVLERNRQIYISKWYNTKRVNQLSATKKPLKISYILASDTPCGGVKIIFEHANRLKNRGHDVKIYCLQKDSNSNWFDINVPIVYGYFDSIKDDISIGSYFTTLPFLQRCSSKIKIHLCQGYEGLLHSDSYITNTIVTNYRMIPTKIVVSKWLKEIIDAEYKISTFHISNAVDPYIFNFKKHKKNNRILIVGYEGLEIKGVSIALDALKPLLGEIQIVRLSSHSRIDTTICEFHLMAQMTQKNIVEVYESCSIMISASSKVEGFCLPPLEAMASGVAVITTDCGGINDYVIDNHNAIIVERNATKIREKVLLLLNNEKLYNTIIDNGLETAKKFLWHHKIDELENLFYKLISESISNNKLQLSVCMIVKNEEYCLKKCLESIKDITSEIIIVDTGSTDNTITIAQEFGAKIYHYEWNDDFAEARNFSLTKATNNWILILDADESISSKDLYKFESLLKVNYVYRFITRNYVTDSNVEGIQSLDDLYEEQKKYVGWCKSVKVRLFPNKINIKFEGKIHEIVENTIHDLEIIDCDIPIHHYGYTKEKIEKKKNYYLDLSKKKYGEDKKDLQSIQELALQYLSINNYDEALVLFRKALTLKHDPGILAYLGTTYNLLEDYNVAEKYFLKSLEISENEYALKHLAICYAKQNKFNKAYHTFSKFIYLSNDLKTFGDYAFCCLQLKKYDDAISILEKAMKIDENTVKSWSMLEIAYNGKGIELAKKNKFAKAELLFRIAFATNPGFIEAKNNLEAIKKEMLESKKKEQFKTHFDHLKSLKR